MVTNKAITYYHKTINSQKIDGWERYVFEDVWVFGGKGAGINKGYENANDVNVRIPIERISNINIFSIGDIIAIGVQSAIQKQSDLKGQDFYNVTSINVNDFGNNQHIHLGGK